MQVIQTRKNDTRFTDETYERLADLESDLTRFAFRLGHLCSVDAELQRVRRGKPFLPFLPMWDFALSERDMLIIELASWALGFYEKCGGGFLRKLRGEDFRALALKLDGVVNPWRQSAFDRLFPGAPNKWPTQADVDALGDRLHARFEPLRDDRNSHRAHPYERRPAKASVKQLALTEVIEHLKLCQEVVGDLRCLASNTDFCHQEVKANPDSREAQDVVDLILCGTLGWIIDFGPGVPRETAARSWKERREDYYGRLHAAHEAGGKPEAAFNNPPFQSAVLNELDLER